MRIDTFEMERMQSTWENLVEMDMSESGVRPVSLRELEVMGLDIESLLDMPLGYSQSNGTIALRENLAAQYAGATVDQIEVTNGTSEANYLLALAISSQVIGWLLISVSLPRLPAALTSVVFGVVAGSHQPLKRALAQPRES